MGDCSFVRALGPATVALAYHFLLVAGYTAALGGDPTVLVCVGNLRAGRPPYETVQAGVSPNGYDGQFYFAIARSPWQRHDEGLDLAPARWLRILYPVLSWLVTGGDPHRLIWAMPVVNLAAIAGLTWLGAVLAQQRGLSCWWALLLPLAMNVAMPALRDLTDVVAACAICGLLVAWLLRWPWWSVTAWAAAAAFARETNVPVVVLVLLAEAVRRRWAAAGIACVLLLWVGWVIALRAIYGMWPLLPQQGNLGIPLAAILDRLRHLNRFSSPVKAGVFLGYIALLVAEIVLVASLLRRGADPVVAVAAAYGAALALTAGAFVYEDHWSYSRAFGCLPLGVWLGCLQVRWRSALVLISLPAILPLLTVGWAVAKQVM